MLKAEFSLSSRRPSGSKVLAPFLSSPRDRLNSIQNLVLLERSMGFSRTVKKSSDMVDDIIGDGDWGGATHLEGAS